MNATRLLQWSLLACTAYFLAMSTAHFIGFKVPVLFVYWDVPSNHYQDMIISFCAFTYATLSFAAYRHRVAVPGCWWRWSAPCWVCPRSTARRRWRR